MPSARLGLPLVEASISCVTSLALLFLRPHSNDAFNALLLMATFTVCFHEVYLHKSTPKKLPAAIRTGYL